MNNIPTLVLSYTNPDLDTYGCALAYAELLRKQGYNAFAGTFGMPIPEVQFMLNYLQEVPLPELNPSDFNQVIVVDCSWPGNLDIRLDRQKVVEVVDHRQGSDPNDFPNADWNIEMVGAAATLIAEKFQAAGIQPSQTAASFLVAGLISNSMNLQSAITNHRDHLMLNWLNQYAQLPPDFANILFSAKSDITGNKLHAQLYGDLTVPLANQFGICQLEMVGVHEAIKNRQTEILANADLIKAEFNLESLLITLIDISNRSTHFITADNQMKQSLAQILNLSFDHDIAYQGKIMLRKEYIPALKLAYHQALVEEQAVA